MTKLENNLERKLDLLKTTFQKKIDQLEAQLVEPVHAQNMINLKKERDFWKEKFLMLRR